MPYSPCFIARDDSTFERGRIDELLTLGYDELLRSSIIIKMDHIIRQAKSKIELYLKAAAMPAEALKAKILQIQNT